MESCYTACSVLQPADIALFSPLKSSLTKAVKEWQMEHFQQVLTKKDFPGVFKIAWKAVTTLEIAVHGFKRAGLFPLNSKAVDASKLGPSKLSSSTPPAAPTDAKAKSSAVTAFQASSSSTSPDTVPASSQVLLRQTCAAESVSSPLVTKTSASATDALEPSTSAANSTSSDIEKLSSSPTLTEIPRPTVIQLLMNKNSPPSVLRSDLSSTPAVHVPSASSSSSLLPVTPSSSTPPVGTILQPVTDQRNPNFIADAFCQLNIPEVKKKNKATIRNKLPKALSGARALQMLKEREQKKISEELAKAKRKEEREKKKKLREEEKEKKSAEKTRKRAEREEAKKNKRKRKRKQQSSDSSEAEENIPYMDSDDDCSDGEICPGCGMAGGPPDEWVGCDRCPRWWHRLCTGDDTLENLCKEDIVLFNFCCSACN